MKIAFVAADPWQKARPYLDDLLAKGTDQLAIACAFCTGAGAKILANHASRLRQSDSCLVVSHQPPTDPFALAELNRLVPTRLRVHLGASAPTEQGAKSTSAMMHSKVFYARRGDHCWLWVGSHNLTLYATQGFNCEAGIMLEGAATDPPMVEALRHIKACWNSAVPFSPDLWPEDALNCQKQPTVLIHAEVDQEWREHPLKWFVHLRLGDASLDDRFRQVSMARLFLYERGHLDRGWQHARPIATFAGELTGLRRTPRHPTNPGSGSLFAEATYIIEGATCLRMVERAPMSNLITTEVEVRIDHKVRPDEVWLKQSPAVRLRPNFGPPLAVPVDPDLAGFIQQTAERKPITGFSKKFEIPENSARESDAGTLSERVLETHRAELVFTGQQAVYRHPLIGFAYYRI